MKAFPHMVSTGCCSLWRLKSGMICIIGLILLSGCNQKYEMYPLQEVLLDSEDRHPIKVTSSSKEMTLNVNNENNGLSANQEARLSRFFISYRQHGHGPINVSMPSARENEQAVYQTAGAIKRVANKYGIAPGYLRIKPYRTEAHEYPFVRLSYNYSVAKTPKCDRWYKNLGINYTNLHYHNFGCADQQNLAAMVANPRDLVRPRALGTRPGERRDQVWDKYIKGESTVSQRDKSEKGTVSEVAK